MQLPQAVHRFGRRRTIASLERARERTGDRRDRGRVELGSKARASQALEELRTQALANELQDEVRGLGSPEGMET